MCGFDKIVMMFTRVHLSLTLKFRFFSMAVQPGSSDDMLNALSSCTSKVIDYIMKRFTVLTPTAVNELMYQ